MLHAELVGMCHPLLLLTNDTELIVRACSCKGLLEQGNHLSMSHSQCQHTHDTQSQHHRCSLSRVPSILHSMAWCAAVLSIFTDTGDPGAVLSTS
jgi:hypothetical protein